jgi:hypothetical protein
MIAAIMAAPAGALVLAIVLVALFGGAKGKVEDAHDEVAQEATAQGKEPVDYETGSSAGDTGCLLLAIAIFVVVAIAIVGGPISQIVAIVPQP